MKSQFAHKAIVCKGKDWEILAQVTLMSTQAESSELKNLV